MNCWYCILYLLSLFFTLASAADLEEVGYFSIRDCFYIENTEGSAILASSKLCKEGKLGAVLALDKAANKRIYNASSQLWYLSPKSGQLINMWEEMYRIEPFSAGPSPRYICLRPRSLKPPKYGVDPASWIVSIDPNFLIPHLIIKNEASDRVLTFNGIDRSVSLESFRSIPGKGGLSAVITEMEPFRLRHASSFYQKTLATISADEHPLRSSITDQRWSFIPIVENLFLIALSTDRRHAGSYLALTDTPSLNCTTPLRIRAVRMDIDDPRQMWFIENSTIAGEVIRNLATGRILDAAMNTGEKNDTDVDPIFNLPPVEDEDNDSDEDPKLFFYLISTPFDPMATKMPIWRYDPKKMEWSIGLPQVLRRPFLNIHSMLKFSHGHLLDEKSKDQLEEEALRTLCPECHRHPKDRSRFAISWQGEESVMLEQLIPRDDADDTLDELLHHDSSPYEGERRIPGAKRWAKLSLGQADDPSYLAKVFGLQTES